MEHLRREPRNVVFASILLALVIWAFLPTLENSFIGYDDPEYVTGNAHVQQGLTLQNVGWAFRSSAASNWHPVTWLSHMVDCDLFGVHAWGHHLTSILLHAANTILVFYLLVAWSQPVWASFLVAILFGIHPLRVESVAWVSERKDVLSGLFFLLTLLVYSKFARERKQTEAEEFRLAATGQPKEGTVVRGWRIYSRAYAWSFLLFVLGLLAKPILVTVPFILLLLDFWPLRRWSKRALPRLLMEKLPFVAAACAVSIVTILVQQHGGAMQLKIPLGLRLENAVVSYTRYIAKLIYPGDLAIFYPYPTHWPLLVVLVALVLLAGITAVAFWLRRTQPFFVVGWLWFVGMLVPVIGIVQVGEQALADRYTYLPSIGIWMALVLGAFSTQLAGKLRLAGTVAICAVIALACGVSTRHQLGYWRDSRTLFSHALAVTTRNPLAHNNLGTALDQAGEVEQAIQQYRLALEIKPSFALAHNNLGTALDRQGKLQEAVKEFIAALEINPFYAEVHHNLAVTLMKMGLVDDAIREYRAALKLKPDYADAHYNLGTALNQKGLREEAIEEYLAALRLQPNSADAHNNLGVAYDRENKLDKAIPEYIEAIRLRPNYVRAYFNLGVALGKTGQIDAAIEQFETALQLKPDYSEARTNLNLLLNLKRKNP